MQEEEIENVVLFLRLQFVAVDVVGLILLVYLPWQPFLQDGPDRLFDVLSDVVASTAFGVSGLAFHGHLALNFSQGQKLIVASR